MKLFQRVHVTRDFFREFRFATTGALIGLVLLVVGVALNLEIFENTLKWLHHAEEYEIDEFVIPVFLVLTGLLFDTLRMHNRQRMDEEKLVVYYQMNEELRQEVADQLNSFVEIRANLIQIGYLDQEIELKLRKLIIRSDKHLKRLDIRGDVDSNLASLVMPKSGSNSLV
jgi:hypothetical protein